MSADVERGPQRRVNKTRNKSFRQDNRCSKYFKTDNEKLNSPIINQQNESNKDGQICDDSKEKLCNLQTVVVSSTVIVNACKQGSLVKNMPVARPSVPVTSERGEESSEDGLLNNSDVLLADMDINWCDDLPGKQNRTADANSKNKQVSHDLIGHIAVGGKSGDRDLLTKHKADKVPTTPINSLKDRIKQRLQSNALVRTLEGPGSLVQHKQEAQLQKVQQEVERLKTEGTSSDIGPFYGLPSKVQQLLHTNRGISKLYDWQDECLSLPGVKDGRNLIYSLPTSGGKTLVAEILILKQLLCNQKDAIIILPFVSIVQEKVRSISSFALELDFLVEEYAASKGRFPPIKHRNKRSLFIATIEKAHSLVNSLIENNRLDSLGLVVVDELHMIGEGGSRGATLESTLLKVIHMQSSTQIIGMSATLSNIEDIQLFLKADVYHNNFRPVKLTEYVKLQDNIYEVSAKAQDSLIHNRVVTFPYSPDQSKTDPDHLMGLVLEVIPSNSCLVFCPTKKNCENVAMMLCKLFVKSNRELCDIKKAEKKALLKELYNDGEQRICPVLQYTVHFGVAYHHSGLTMDERRLIEDAYADGTLCLLTCTSTLAAGVNLPAKRVILRSPYVGSVFLSRTQYKQMSGRAGRAGIDSSGESILITTVADREKVLDLMNAPNEMCYSSLMYDGGKGIRSLILSVIGLQVTTTTNDVFEFMKKTMLCSQGKVDDVVMVTKNSLQQLVDLGLVIQKRLMPHEVEESDFQLAVSSLGRATYKGSVDIDNAAQLYNDLKKAEESLVLATYLHLLYLVTPYDMVEAVKPSWIIYFQQLSALESSELKAAMLIGVPESYIAMKASGQSSRKKVDEFVLNRFYLTLILYELWKQKSLWEVADKFQLPRGFIQNLLSSAASFASCVLHFCQELEEFWAYQDLFGNFVKRLSYCVTAELIPLMEIPGVKIGRARQLYACGFRTLPQVAHADPMDLVQNIKQISKKAALQVITSAKVLLNEKAEALREEVEDLISVPVGNVAMETVNSQSSDILPPTPKNFSQDSVL